MGFQEKLNQLIAGRFKGYYGGGGRHDDPDYSKPQDIQDPPPGHPIVVFPGYGVNPARMNAADLEPIPITPVRWQNWPEMQIQLLNGWMLTNWGRKISYDDYLKQLTSSENKGRAYLTPNRGANVNIGPSPLNVASWQQSGPGAQPNNPGAPGQTVGGVTNGGFYG
jgi:hypothetical protein